MADDDKYDVLEKIGQGSFGIIRKVRRKADGYVLCRKEISYSKMSAKEKEQLQAELSILKELRHPNIVAYIDRVHLKSSHDLHVYMEYCGNGDLGQVIKKLKTKRQYADEEFVWSIFSQIVCALYRCHYGDDPPEAGRNVMGLGNDAIPNRDKQKNLMILHRDLKPENVFLGADNSVKLGDFGLSKIMQSHDFASTYVGTPYYMSPEICMSEKYTLYSDIWALGCIIYELCAQRPPFDAKTHFELIQKIRRGYFDPLPEIYSPELKKVVASCLNVQSGKRPETAQLLNLPIVKLMRKEQEVVQLGQLLKKERELVKHRETEFNKKLESSEQEKEVMRLDIEAQLRREWELKARLEIDQQVSRELEKLRKTFEVEVEKQVSQQVDIRMHAWKLQQNSGEAGRSSTPTFDGSEPHKSCSTSGEQSDFPSQTDISSYSLESSGASKPKAETPNKQRPPRQAFQRAHTTAFNEVAGSPMDIQMADPSPISLAGLSLSPRRNQQANEPKIRRNIFAAADRWQPTNMSDPVSPTQCPESPTASSEDEMEDDSMPTLPSPTRARSVTNLRKMNADNDPFKAMTAGNAAQNAATRLMLDRRANFKSNILPQRTPTAPNAALANLRAGGTANSGPSQPPARPRPTSTVPIVATSPQRKKTTPPAADGVFDTGFRSKKGAISGLRRDVLGNAINGRTLVELNSNKVNKSNSDNGSANARDAARRSSGESGSENEGPNGPPGRKGSEGYMEQKHGVAKWNMEDPNCPSPFLRKGTGGVRGLFAGTAALR
ncbi:kinase-like domain-containing protein [Phyllosticta citrichinensis]|uniref:non-specific serine/threonine protein kinase n=1 Tax=Phyllosticta citrichinensis TaxID=1130410 RepID=A0ABR1XTR2_9PEZI